MRRLSTLLLLPLLCGAYAATAQSYTIRGSVLDTLNNNPLYRASVVLIRTSDTVIQTFGRTTQSGDFTLKAPKPGKYMLRISFPSFADYTDIINVKKETTDLGTLPMVSKTHLLQEFVLHQQVAAIKIKGDTTEYMADSFKVKENATVEDLLKKLPGIQVDKNGQITAQGETVQKILVDGEEFFSDDPKVVTKGLQANAVNKVQVFDKKSEQAEFTGIDDGQKEKTINLELKEDKKKGYFGKADAGGGSNGYFQNQAMLNAFKAKRQFSAFGIVSNTDKAGLGWQDNDKFGSGNNSQITESGDFVTVFDQSDDEMSGWNGRYNGEGLPKTWTGGVHYADKWNENKDHITGNYRYAMQDVELDGNSTIQRLLTNDSSSINDQHKNQFSKGERHGLNVLYETKLDSNTSLKITADAGRKNADVATIYDTKAIYQNAERSDTILDNHRTINSKAQAEYINADLVLRKKFAKKGRTLSLDAKENYKESQSDGHLNSSFLNPVSGNELTPAIDQRKLIYTNTLAFQSKLIYTEPLSKVAFVEANYDVTVNNSLSSNKSYDGAGYTHLNDTFSSDYKYNILTNAGGLNFRFVYKNYNFSFGSDVSHASYLQTDRLHGDTTRTYNFTNLFPRASFNYKLSRQTNLSINYNGSTQQPTIAQIQPLRQNTDPLNIVVGNPDLKQAFNNKLSIHFNDFKMLSNRYLWGNITANTMSNAITTEQTTINGINTTKYINLDGAYNAFAFVGYGLKIPRHELEVGVMLNGSTSHTKNKINGLVNTSDNTMLSPGLRFDYEKEINLTSVSIRR
jgi:hypothetical protein